jgi:hypothetical protein
LERAFPAEDLNLRRRRNDDQTDDVMLDAFDARALRTCVRGGSPDFSDMQRGRAGQR